MSVLRPLPPKPSLEFERKEAKALLRQLRANDAEALGRARAQHPAMFASPSHDVQLADAQLVIAREYGFASWPRLVRYFGELERLLKRTPSAMQPGLYRPEDYPQTVQHFMAKHQRRVPSAARSLITFVPRYYGLSEVEAYDMALTVDEAQLAVARRNGFPSWEALMARVQADASDPMRRYALTVPPRRRAYDALSAGDLALLKAVVKEHPDLLTPTEREIATSAHFLAIAIRHEREAHAQGTVDGRMRPIIDWLVSVGFDEQLELNICLCGDMRTTAEDVQYWIDRGADPDWIAPNGYSVLEHAIVRYWNGKAIDRLARYATVRQPALWIAAGLGDVAGVASFLDNRGRPTEKAHVNRPQFDAIGPHTFSPLPGDDDGEVLMEAAWAAFLNERSAVMEYLATRGFPIDTLRWEVPLIVMAVGNNKVEMVEALVRAGANLDLRGTYNGSAREMARDMLMTQPPSASRRRIAELCGLDADAILAERDALPPTTPHVAQNLARALRLANDDAHRLGRTVVSSENLLVGLLRAGFPAVPTIVDRSGLDREKFRAAFEERVAHAESILEEATELTLDAEAQDAMNNATGLAAEKRRDAVSAQYLLLALTNKRNGVVVQTVERYGGRVDKVKEVLEGML